MKQCEIVHRVAAAMDSPDQMVRMPAGFQRQRLTTQRTVPLLLQPKVTRRSAAGQGAGHLRRETLLEVQLPGRIVRIGLTPDFHVTANRQRPCPEQDDGMMAAVRIRHNAATLPATVARPSEVFSLHPSRRLVPVPSPCPTP